MRLQRRKPHLVLRHHLCPSEPRVRTGGPSGTCLDNRLICPAPKLTEALSKLETIPQALRLYLEGVSGERESRAQSLQLNISPLSLLLGMRGVEPGDACLESLILRRTRVGSLLDVSPRKTFRSQPRVPHLPMALCLMQLHTHPGGTFRKARSIVRWRRMEPHF